MLVHCSLLPKSSPLTLAAHSPHECLFFSFNKTEIVKKPADPAAQSAASAEKASNVATSEASQQKSQRAATSFDFDGPFLAPEDGSQPRSHTLVVDSAAFIRNVPLERMAKNIVTIPQVIEELRDEETRRRLDQRVYDLHFREPSAEALKAVSNFAKLTGDFVSLSATDLRVLALTYMLEVEANGKAHIRTKPKPVRL